MSNIVNIEKPFLPRRALVLKKFSRLEYERSCNKTISEEILAQRLSQRGSDYETLRHHDQEQRSCLRQIESVLSANNIEHQIVDRSGYTEEKVDWADVIITSGGDGTFLMAASKVPNRDKPVIGINNDPSKSFGHLCLPDKYTNHFDQVIDSLRTGKYQWQYRQRLRVTLTGDAALEKPLPLDDTRYIINQEDSSDNHSAPSIQSIDGATSPTVKELKERVLNEIFVGEQLSARVSRYELSVDNNKPLKYKSSGLTVCTGTGSTAWYFNSNKMTPQQVKTVLEVTNTKINTNDKNLVDDIMQQCNEKLLFHPTEPIMAYSIRDNIGYAPSSTGNAKCVGITSRMQNGSLVIDGRQYYTFNNGSFALIEIYDEDALKTLSLPGKP